MSYCITAALKAQLHSKKSVETEKMKIFFMRNLRGMTAGVNAKSEYGLDLYTLFCVQIDE